MYLGFQAVRARLKKNFWLMEIGIFSILYGTIIIVSNSNAYFFTNPNFSWTWIEQHVGLFFIFSGAVSVLLSFCRRNFRTYMIAYSIMSFAVFARLFGVLDGDVPSTDEALVILWLQILLLQGKMLSLQEPKIFKQKLKRRTPNYSSENVAPHFTPRAEKDGYK